jgi:hypothetical protein
MNPSTKSVIWDTKQSMIIIINKEGGQPNVVQKLQPRNREQKV